MDEITGEIVDAAVKLHNRLGPGLMESVYELFLGKELGPAGAGGGATEPITIEIDGIRVENAFRVDMLINSGVVVELKSVEAVAPVHFKQVLTYLRLLDLRVGLLINFGAATMKEGLHRIENAYVPSAPPRLRVNQPSA
jgi:iron complex transport system substrate-binding protein